MRQLLKAAVKRAVHAAGFTLERISREQPNGAVHKLAPDEEDKSKWLKKLGVRTVLDVGANTGQFAQDIRATLPEARIYSFEPLKDCYAKLVGTMAHAPKFHALNFALGADNTETTINRSSFSPSSSLLPMSAVTKEAFPFTDEGWSSEVIRVRRLDDVASELDLTDNILIKIDVQGFEDRVIRGGWNTIQKAKLLIIEVSFLPLYEGQPLFADIDRTVRDAGFVYRGTTNQLLNPSDGMPLQADAIFLKATSGDV